MQAFSLNGKIFLGQIMKRILSFRPSPLATISMIIAANTYFATSAFAQSQISKSNLSLAQEECIKAAQNKGFTVDSIVSSKAEAITGEVTSKATQVTVVLALTKAGYAYTLTCPLTLEEEVIVSSTVEKNAAVSATSRVADKTITTKAESSAWWWLFSSLIGLLTLLWLLIRKHPARDQGFIQPTYQNDRPDQPLSLQTPATPKTAEKVDSLKAPTIASAEVESTLPDKLSRDYPMEDKDFKPIELNPLTDEQVLSVIQEEMTVGTQQIARSKVRVHKRVETREEVVNAPIVHEQVFVDRIPINQLIEGDIPTERDEGDVHIIPIFEEVAVAETQLMLREEVHISKQRLTETAHQTATLRREVAEVERTALEGNAPVAEAVPPDHLTAQQPTLEWSPPEPGTDNVRATQPVAPTNAAEIGPSSFDSNPRFFAEPPGPMGSSTSSRENAPAVATSEEVVIPVMAEEVTLETQAVARGKVRVHTRVETREQMVSAPAMREELVIQHIPINQYVQGALPTEREEAGVRIIPILEEVVISKTQLFLREELHISKRRTTETVPQMITLRHEVVDVEQTDLENDTSGEN